MRYVIDLALLKRNRNFRLLFVGQFVSFTGSMITSVALPYQIYHETQSTLMVGLASLFQLIPLLFTALMGGVFADRYHRRLLLVFSELLLAVGCLLLALNVYTGSSHLWIVFVVATVMSAITGLHRPALESITQQIVAPKDFPDVSALRTAAFSICMIAGPAVGGIVIAHFGLLATYLLDFASFFISLAALLMMSHIPKPPSEIGESVWTSLWQGFRYAAAKQELLGTYFVDFAAMIFGMPTALFPAIAESLGGAKTLGLLYSAPAVGALAISCFSGWPKVTKHHGIAIALAAALWGVSMIFFGLATHLWVALCFLCLAGAFDGISGIFRMIVWNETIPPVFRGRLAGIEMISYLSGPKLGDTEAGLVAAAFGVTASIVSGGVLCVVGVALCCYCLPKFWRYQSN